MFCNGELLKSIIGLTVNWNNISPFKAMFQKILIICKIYLYPYMSIHRKNAESITIIIADLQVICSLL